VLRADVVVLELPGLFLGKDNDLAGSLCKSLKHLRSTILRLLTNDAVPQTLLSAKDTR
jgi:hypothetical protein